MGHDTDMSGSGEQGTTEMSNGTTNFTILPPSGDEVWLFLLTLIGLLVVSLVFLIIILVYKKIERKKSVKYVHEQQKRRNGSQASVYLVRSQEIELQSSRARSPEFVNVLENIDVNTSSQEQLIQSSNRSSNDCMTSLVAGEENAGHHEEHTAMEGGERRTERGITRETKMSTCNRVESNRAQEFIGRGLARRSIARSESELDRVRQEQVNFDKQFSRQMSVRVGNHRDDKVVRQREMKDKLVGAQQSTVTPGPGEVSRVGAGVIQEVSEAFEHHEESVDGRQSIAIHQVQSPVLLEDNRIPVAGLRIDIANTFGDIPSFKDPELIGDDGDDSGLLGPPAPPDIYSSQILNTVESPEEADDESENEECSGVITETNQHSRSLDRIISVQPPTYESDASDADEEFMGLDPRYTRVLIKSRPQSVEDTDNLYDEPIMVTTPTTDRLLLTPIFDDPGYDQGFISLGSIATASTKNNQSHHLCAPDQSLISRNETSRMEETGESGASNNRMVEATAGELRENLTTSGPADSQLGVNEILSRSTLALLNFGEEELKDMDPDILSHLQQEDGTHAA